jgi:hypothetical protein
MRSFLFYRWMESYNSVFDSPQKIKKMSFLNNSLMSEDQISKYSSLLNQVIWSYLSYLSYLSYNPYFR